MRITRFGKRKLLCCAAASLAMTTCLLAGKPASAQTGDGSLYALGGSVTATLLSSEASLTNLFFVTGQGASTSLFSNKAAVDTSASVGSFAAGTELIFGIQIQETGQTFLAGPASRNPDAVVHARVTFEAGTNSAILAFEDLFTGGDQDYNDTRVRISGVSNTAIPEPSTMALVGAGLLSLVGGTLRRRKA